MTRFIYGCCLALAACLTSSLAVVATPGASAIAAPPGEISAAPSGEVWEWALGRSPWTDTDLKKYFHPIAVAMCGSAGQCPGWAESLDDGWKANPGGDGNVVSVELFNDETTLGTPDNPNTANASRGDLMRAYKGKLPLEKTWATTATDMGAVYGARNMLFGRTPSLRIPMTFEYFTDDGRYKFWFEFYAMTPQDLPNARVHKIEVFRGPKY